MSLLSLSAPGGAQLAELLLHFHAFLNQYISIETFYEINEDAELQRSQTHLYNMPKPDKNKSFLALN